MIAQLILFVHCNSQRGIVECSIVRDNIARRDFLISQGREASVLESIIQFDVKKEASHKPNIVMELVNDSGKRKRSIIGSVEDGFFINLDELLEGYAIVIKFFFFGEECGHQKPIFLLERKSGTITLSRKRNHKEKKQKKIRNIRRTFR